MKMSTVCLRRFLRVGQSDGCSMGSAEGLLGTAVICHLLLTSGQLFTALLEDYWSEHPLAV